VNEDFVETAAHSYLTHFDRLRDWSPIEVRAPQTSGKVCGERLLLCPKTTLELWSFVESCRMQSEYCLRFCNHEQQRS
jgi:hypothetical protein